MKRFLAGVVVGVAIAAVSAKADSDVPQLVAAAAVAHHVNPGWMEHTASCESGYNRYAFNPAGYVGLFQLGPGLQREFYGWAPRYGLVPDLYDPAQQSNFAAELFAHGRAGNWTCAR